MRNKRIASIFAVVSLLIISLIGCGTKSMETDFIKNIVGEQGTVSAFDNNDGVIKANITGDFNRDSLEEIVHKIYSKSKEEKVKENKVTLNIYASGDNPNFTEGIDENMSFNIEISLDKETYELKSINKIENISHEDVVGDFSNGKLISAKDNNIEIETDINLENLEKEEVMKRIKTYVELFLSTNKDKEIKDIKITVNSEENKSYFYNTEMEEVLVAIEKEIKF